MNQRSTLHQIRPLPRARGGNRHRDLALQPAKEGHGVHLLCIEPESRALPIFGRSISGGLVHIGSLWGEGS